jgi:hypothetical protein
MSSQLFVAIVALALFAYGRDRVATTARRISERLA